MHGFLSSIRAPFTPLALAVALGLAPSADGRLPVDPPVRSAPSGPVEEEMDHEGLEGADDPGPISKPTGATSRPARFDPKAFFAAWGTENAQFDHDGSGTVDCPDLEHAIKQAGGGRASANPGAIVLTSPAAKEGTLTARASLPTSIVKAWGTDATNFDFDGNGVVGCGDVAGFIANDLKPLAPGAKALQAPATAPKGSVPDPSVKAPDAVKGLHPKTEARGSTGVGSAPSGGAAGSRPSGGGRGTGAPAGFNGGGGGGGSSGRRSAASAPSPPPSSTFSGALGGANGGSGSVVPGAPGGSGGIGDSGNNGGSGGSGSGGSTGGGSTGGSGGGSTGGGSGGGSTGGGSGGGGGGSGGGSGGGGEVTPQPGRDEVAIRYRAGTPGGPDESDFTWIVRGVRQAGTFVDGTPWITVDAGAQLVDLSPKSVRKRTFCGREVWIDGSAKNPIARRYINPNSMEGMPVAGLVFDGRSVRLSPPSQQLIDSEYDLERNIGIVPPGRRTIAPVGLAPGDVIVTADSEWVENETRIWGAGDGVAIHASPGRRTAIKRFGVLTVLHEAPTQVSFRPPMQWIPGAEASRPAPIPVARVRNDEQALLHNSPGLRGNPDHLLSGPTFHDGGGVGYQSSHAIFALTTNLSGGSNVTYGGNLAGGVLGPALLQATNVGQPSVRRERMRNRLIQYGIDCHGSLLSLVQSSAGAGQRSAELKPWIMLAGWWLEQPSMQNPYQAVRDLHPGTAIASASDVEIGIRFFHDDHVCRQVMPGLGLIQRWGPRQPHRVTAASTVTSSSLCNIEPVQGQFGRLQVDGVPLAGDGHARRPFNFYGRYLRIDSGAGAGPTVYKVIRVGGDRLFADWIEVDRPWAHGLPDATSSVTMYPFRNGDAFPGDVADIGRWYYSREAQRSSLEHDDFSPLSDGYAKISAAAFIVPYAALKGLADRTGNRDYLRGTTWNWLSEIVGGTGTTPNGERFGACPDSDRILNLFWDRRGYLSGSDIPIVKGWMGVTDVPGSFGYRDLSRIPGVRR